MRKNIFGMLAAILTLCGTPAAHAENHIGMDMEEADMQAAQQDEALPVGSVAPAFTLEGIDGKPVALSSLRGKVLVLDFWGSWCIWCIRGIPKMKEYYAKYKDKMEILGMDCGDTKEGWKAAVKKHELPWRHAYVPKGSPLTKDYLIQGFPTKIIVSPEGKVLETVVGEDPRFYDLLDKMFK